MTQNKELSMSHPNSQGKLSHNLWEVHGNRKRRNKDTQAQGVEGSQTQAGGQSRNQPPTGRAHAAKEKHLPTVESLQGAVHGKPTSCPFCTGGGTSSSAAVSAEAVSAGGPLKLPKQRCDGSEEFRGLRRFGSVRPC